MAEIKVDYQDTINKARELENISNSIKNAGTKDISSISEYCSSAWKGDASDAYRKKMEKIKNKIVKRGTDLKKTAQSLEDAAIRYKRIEESAVAIFTR